MASTLLKICSILVQPYLLENLLCRPLWCLSEIITSDISQKLLYFFCFTDLLPCIEKSLNPTACMRLRTSFFFFFGPHFESCMLMMPSLELSGISPNFCTQITVLSSGPGPLAIPIRVFVTSIARVYVRAYVFISCSFCHKHTGTTLFFASSGALLLLHVCAAFMKPSLF